MDRTVEDLYEFGGVSLWSLILPQSELLDKCTHDCTLAWS